MSGTTIVDSVLDFLGVDVVNTDEEELSGVWDISHTKYQELIKVVEQLLREERV